MSRDDWPIGPALQKARIAAGLSVREAARRTKGAVSSGRWYQLESGYQKAGGHEIPISTTPATVAAAAKAVQWDAAEALTVAGFSPTDVAVPEERTELSEIPIDDLLAEIKRRVERGERHDLEAAPQPSASPQAVEDQEVKSGGEVKTPLWFPSRKDIGKLEREKGEHPHP